MSMHEWYEVVWGVELPGNIDEDRLVAFVENHRNDLLKCVDASIFPNVDDKSEVIDFAKYYETDDSYGINAMLADIIGMKYIGATRDEYGCLYIGIFEWSIFPWNKDSVSSEYMSLTQEEVESAIKPVVEELYGTCPKFCEHTVWNYG